MTLLAGMHTADRPSTCLPFEGHLPLGRLACLCLLAYLYEIFIIILKPITGDNMAGCLAGVVQQKSTQ